MTSFDLVPDLAARLDALVPTETPTGDWGDVVRRVDSRPARRLRPLTVALALCLLLLLAVVATATYLALHANAPHPGALTVRGDDGHAGSARIVEIRPNGKTRVVWRCPRSHDCGTLSSFDWASDGRHLAITLNDFCDCTGVRPKILGLHILDIATGRDFHMPQETEDRLGGCLSLETVTWSPDGRTLAFGCPRFPSPIIAVVSRDGRAIHRVDTRLFTSSWPTWSPDGERLAFAGYDRVGHGRPPQNSSIYVIRLDGTGRVLVAPHGDTPAWSPDGKTIAYQARDGIRLVTPDGVDVTPNGHALTPNGIPSWSPDGDTLAVATDSGVYLVAKTDAGLKYATSLGGADVRPAWYPAKRAPAAQEQPDCGPC